MDVDKRCRTTLILVTLLFSLLCARMSHRRSLSTWENPLACAILPNNFMEKDTVYKDSFLDVIERQEEAEFWKTKGSFLSKLTPFLSF